ncbi:MAG: phosphonate ABC transporter, permease protein PhnE [Methylococcales bacterium]|nr:phosphonate ABC transporter, permease protein PhnE [Methylococcales bacterium]
MSIDQALPAKPRSWLPLWLSLLLALLYVIAVDLELDGEALLYGLEDMAGYFARFGSPDFSNLSSYLQLLAQTLAIAVWGSVLALIAAVMIAPFAAITISPNALTYRLARELLNFMRAMPDLLLALLFVAALGLGPMPGVLALAVHTAGFLGKFFAESMERVPAGRYEAMASVGAGFTQTLIFAVWPSMLREAIGNTLYIFDRNVRMAAVLGLVGAGGIGLELHDTLRLFRYDQSSALIMVMLITIIAIDQLSTWIRKKLT